MKNLLFIFFISSVSQADQLDSLICSITSHSKIIATNIQVQVGTLRYIVLKSDGSIEDLGEHSLCSPEEIGSVYVRFSHRFDYLYGFDRYFASGIEFGIVTSSSFRGIDGKGICFIIDEHSYIKDREAHDPNHSPNASKLRLISAKKHIEAECQKSWEVN